MYAEAFSIWHANPFLHFKAREKKTFMMIQIYFGEKKVLNTLLEFFFKSFRKMEWSLRLKLISKNKELWYFTECTKVYCITIIVWCIHIYDVHGWMKLDARSILNWKSERLVYCCISLICTNLLANNIYRYRFESTCRPKCDKFDQTFIEHSLNLWKIYNSLMNDIYYFLIAF